MTEEIFKVGTKVWIHSMERDGMIVNTVIDQHMGPQYLVSIRDDETIEDTFPYIQRWIKNTDISSIHGSKRSSK
jgi:hypothetical protein